MEKDESCLEDLKKDYSELQKKHDLPGFEDMNKDFQIEKIAEEETDYLAREVRKFVADKIANYLRFIESILHPVNAPIFVFSIIKTLGADEQTKIMEIYRVLSKIEIEIIELDVEYSEEKEISFIKRSFDAWQKIKKDLLAVTEIIKNNWDNKFEVDNKGYFG